MKKVRNAHLWIGLICSVFILMESITGLLMNEPWLIGQSQTERIGNFQQGQMPPGLQQGTTSDSNQTTGQTGGQFQPNSQTDFNSNRQFRGQAGSAWGPGREGLSQNSLMSTIRGLHEGRIGTTNIKWLIDLIAIAMIFLTGTGIYLSIKVLRANNKRKKASMDKQTM